MRTRNIAAALSIAFTVAMVGTSADAANQFIYVVNGTDHPFTLSIDGDASPEMAHLVGAFRIITAGGHTLGGQVAGAPKVALAVDLKTTDSVSDHQQHEFWCFVAGQRANGELVFVAANQPQCAELLRKAADGFPPR